MPYTQAAHARQIQDEYSYKVFTLLYLDFRGDCVLSCDGKDSLFLLVLRK